MFVFTNLSVWTIPVPSVLIFFNSLQKELTDDFGSGTFHHLLFLCAEEFIEIVFGQSTELLASNGIHDKLNSLIDIKIDFLGSVECEIVGVKTFFAFLTESLLEVRADSVGWVTI